jgi:glycosyltransferase involved in cell wall biosynthesis
VRQRAGEFDLLHFHIDQFHFPLFRSIACRTVTTLHGRQDLPDLLPLYLGFDDMPLVSISNDQRRPLPNANFSATVYHGLPVGLHRPIAEPRGGGYVAFLGRISPEKRPDRAIAIARSLGVPLKIAAKVDRADDVYFRTHIEPLLNVPGVEFIGEINEHQKTQFLGEAQALLFPVDWPEPFGLSMIEAMACGTPVLAFRCGSVPEIIEDGLTGAIVDTMEQALVALPHVMALDRKKVRKRFEQRFSATRMAKDYVDVYRSLLESSTFAGGEERDTSHRLPDGNGANDLRPQIA